MMRWQLTSHAVDRYIARIAPGVTHERAAAEMREALGKARRDRFAEPKIARGQVLAGAAPGRTLTHFIVLPPTDPTTRGRPIVVTCWPSDFVGDDAEEVLAALRTVPSTPRSWSPDVAVAVRSKDWAALVGMLEVARLRAVGYEVELAKASAHRDLLMRLAMEVPEARRVIAEVEPDLVVAAHARTVHVQTARAQ